MPVAFLKMWVPEIQIHAQELFFFYLLSYPQPLVVIKKQINKNKDFLKIIYVHEWFASMYVCATTHVFSASGG